MAKALRNAAALIYCTAEERDQSRPPSGIPASRQHVVPLPVEVPADLPPRPEMAAAARKRFNIPAAAPAIVFMGRLHPVKQVELTLQAVALASKSIPDLHLVLIGDGEPGYVAGLKAAAAQLGIADRVRWPGFVLGTEKWASLAAGVVLTLNSKHENFGFVAVEALCVGTAPILTSNLALAPELAAAGGGVSCEPTAAALAAAYVETLNSPDRAAVVRRGREWVDAHLSAHAVGSALAELYRFALAKRPH
jgi:glycosyltransferase involved in cell wall biosynthesis